MNICPRNLKVIVPSLFIGFFVFGLWLACHKTLSNDEFYTQVSSVHGQSYWQVLKGHTSEGNTSPFFYLLQKAMCDVFGYHLPESWAQGEWSTRDMPSQLFLRINPDFFMSLTVVSIFYFFARFYSLWTGFYSLFLSLGSYMVWAYWVEARPYALWVFLTSMQALFFLYLIRQEKISRPHWNALTAIHLFLSLTVVFAVSQIVIVSFLLWIRFKRRLRHFFLLTLVPVALCIFYYAHSPKYQWWFSLTPEQLIRECFSRDRFYVLFIYILCLGLFYVQKKTNAFRLFYDDEILRGRVYAAFVFLMVLAAAAALLVFKWKESAVQNGFPVSSRYFIYLTPVGIIGTTFFSAELMRSFRHKRWVQLVLGMGIGYLVFCRFLKVMAEVKGLYPGCFL